MDMDEYKKTIEQLKKDLENKEKDIYLAATYGKQLLCENGDLRRRQEELLSHTEALKQENHCLQLSIDGKVQTVKVQAAEIESLKESLESVSPAYKQLKKDDALLMKNYNDLKKENCDLKKAQEDMISTSSELRKQVESLQDQVKEYQDQMDQSLNETLFSEEYQKMQTELSSLSKEKVNLELALHEAQYELNQMKNKETKLIKKYEELQEEIADKDKEISTYSVLIEKSKEEAADLRGEIEMLKLEQVDVKRRGNSIFGELDDRRLEVEKRYIELRDKYKSREEQYTENLVTLRRTKNQLASALACMSFRNVDAEYTEQLEHHLSCSKREIRDLTERLIQAEEKNQKAAGSLYPEDMAPQKNPYDYLRALLQLSEKKVKALEEDLTSVRRLKVLDNGKLMEAENRLYFAEKEAISCRTQALKLKLQLDELQAKDKENVIRAPKEEMIPGFVKKSEDHKQNCHANNDVLVKSQTSQPSEILSSTSAKLNKNALQKDDAQSTEGHDSGAFDIKKQNKFGLTNTKSVTHADVPSDTICIQQ